MRSAPLALVAFLALLAPAATAQSAVPVDRCSRECDPASVNHNAVASGDANASIVFYGHFFDVLNIAPLNTQMPDPWTEKDLDAGFAAPTVDTNTNLCLPQSNTCADFHFKNNDFTMVLQPDEVGPSPTNPQNAFAPMTAYDLTIAARDVHAYWYMSAEATRASNGPVGVVPALGMHAELGTGGFKGHGTLLASTGDLEELTATRVNMLSVPGQASVYEFQLDLKVVEAHIPSGPDAHGFHVSITPYQLRTPTDGAAEASQSGWHVHTGAVFPPRIILPLTTPLRAGALTFLQRESRLYAHWNATSAFGTYDVDPATARVTIDGPSTVPPGAFELLYGGRTAGRPDTFLRPVTLSWSLDTHATPLADGTYHVRVSVENRQHSYETSNEANIVVAHGLPEVAGNPMATAKASPGLDPVGVLAGVVALVAFLHIGSRRRPRQP